MDVKPCPDDVAAHVPPVRLYLLGFSMLGLLLGLIGPSLSHLKAQVGTDDSGIALLFVGQSVGYIGGSLIGGRRLDGGHGHRTWSLVMIAAVVAIGGVVASTGLLPLVLAFAVLGAACGTADVSGNTLVLWSRPGSAGALLNGLHLCFAIGSLTAPLAVNRAIAWSGSLWPVAVPLAVGTAICASGFARTSAPSQRSAEAIVAPGATARPVVPVAVLVALCGFFLLYVGVEVGFAGWIHSYVEQIGYGGANTATGVTVAFWAGFTVGRVAAIWIATRWSPGMIVSTSMTGAVLTAGLFALRPSGGASLWVIAFMFAMAIAPQYASMIAYIERSLSLSGSATSAIVASSGIGGLVVPWITGALFDRVGPGALPKVVLISAVLAALAALVVRSMLLAVQRPPVTSMKAPVT